MGLSQLGTPLFSVGCHSPGIGDSHTSFFSLLPPPPLPPSTLVETLLDDLSLLSVTPLPHSRPLESLESPFESFESPLKSLESPLLSLESPLLSLESPLVSLLPRFPLSASLFLLPSSLLEEPLSNSRESPLPLLLSS